MNRTDNLFVVDTNTLVSAFILPKSVARRSLEKASIKGAIVQSRSIANEFSEVFIRPKFDKYLPLAIRLKIINDFLSVTSIVEPQITITASRDHKDDQFLELAVAVNATCIISGDKDLLILDPFRNIRIVSASGFLNLDL